MLNTVRPSLNIVTLALQANVQNYRLHLNIHSLFSCYIIPQRKEDISTVVIFNTLWCRYKSFWAIPNSSSVVYTVVYVSMQNENITTKFLVTHSTGLFFLLSTFISKPVMDSNSKLNLLLYSVSKRIQNFTIPTSKVRGQLKYFYGIY